MKLLILGGTQFLGRSLVERALEAGHELTLFHRGRTNPELFPGVARRLGDRATDLRLLEDSEWDAVVDTCGQDPRDVRASAAVLSGRVRHYTFVSTISVYRDFGARGRARGAETLAPADESETLASAPERYGHLKMACENAALEEMGGRCCVVRPGLIVGPHDPTDRFTYWPLRFARGGEVLAPAPRERLVQVIDVRDLADFLLTAAESELSGVFDAVGPAAPLNFEQMVDTCAHVAGTDSSVSWADPDWLLEQEVEPWSELPLWIPGTDAAIDVAPAVGAGLRHRSLAETARATLEWARAREDAGEPRAGLRPDKERALLERWRARESGDEEARR